MKQHADDLGLHSRANQAILKLIESGDVTSVSVLVTTAGFSEIADHLRDIKVPTFLHFSLTEGDSVSGEMSFVSQMKFIKLVLMHKLRTANIRTELTAQYEKLQACGVKIAGIDTHQHVHAFEPVASVVTAFAEANNIEHIRSYKEAKVLHPTTHIVKSAYKIIGWLSAFPHLPISWRQKRWVPFVMATWEKVPLDGGSGLPYIVVTHPGTEFDCTTSLFRQIMAHIFRVRK